MSRTFGRKGATGCSMQVEPGIGGFAGKRARAKRRKETQAMCDAKRAAAVDMSPIAVRTRELAKACRPS